MSAAEDALRAEIAAQLIYADQLDERGDPEGEAIRIRCALRMKPCSMFMYSCYEFADVCSCDDEPYTALRKRLAELESRLVDTPATALAPAPIAGL